ncbi:hypothetical protein MKZ38_007366 [Zalerion maritima]|uniref:Uncharacterized protein n=1 Tax=Zalerion maritima TaxID=339359 RepID=A0AAD5RHW1_9PEZI|nr:hypothetical protein MKZ38_007366 [Zalerion maritima]
MAPSSGTASGSSITATYEEKESQDGPGLGPAIQYQNQSCSYHKYIPIGIGRKAPLATSSVHQYRKAKCVDQNPTNTHKDNQHPDPNHSLRESDQDQNQDTDVDINPHLTSNPDPEDSDSDPSFDPEQEQEQESDCSSSPASSDGEDEAPPSHVASRYPQRLRSKTIGAGTRFQLPSQRNLQEKGQKGHAISPFGMIIPSSNNMETYWQDMTSKGVQVLPDPGVIARSESRMRRERYESE